MLDAKKIAQLRKLKVLSKKIFNSNVAGEYKSFLSGSGFDFLKLRNYEESDDIRFLDWNAFAKTQSLLIRETAPERDRALIIALDCSASQNYSSQEYLKSEIALELAYALAWLGLQNKDRVGFLAFGGSEKPSWLNFSKNREHLFSIFDLATELMGKLKEGSIKSALDFLFDLKSKKSILFLVSDFLEKDLDSLKKKILFLSKKHSIVPILVNDPKEGGLQDLNLIIKCSDPETGEITSLSMDQELNDHLEKQQRSIINFFKGLGLRPMIAKTTEPALEQLVSYFGGSHL